MPVLKPPATAPDLGPSQKKNFLLQFAEAQLPRSDYRYQHLGENEIRLLRLHAAESSTDTIVCSFKTVNLNKPHQVYDALSYTWGTEEPTQKIVLHTRWARSAATGKARLKNLAQKLSADEDGIMKSKVYVRPNLEDVLRQFRGTDAHQEDLFLWVDAMCIDQDDEKEKSEQVAKMAEIYSKARDVLIWLGKEYNASNVAMSFIPKILDLEQSDLLISKASNRNQWIAFADLMKREWFSRRWVVQEVALAKHRYMYCGNKALNWSDFERAVSFFTDKVDTILAMFTSSAEFRHNAKILEEIRALGATAMVNITNEYFRWGADGSYQRLSSLEKLVASLPMFESLDPRDTIFGLLSIANDTRDWDAFSAQSARSRGSREQGRVQLEADYTKTVLEVFKDFTAFCVRTSSSLDIICRHWAPSQFWSSNILYRIKKKYANEQSEADPSVRVLLEDGKSSPMTQVPLPSWIGLLSQSPYGVPDGGTKIRRAGESLVGAPDDPGQRYKASGNTRPLVLFGEVDASHDQNSKAVPVLFRNQIPRLGSPQHRVTAEETLTQGRGRQSDGTIYVYGFEIDTIEQVSHRLFEGMIPAEWLHYGGWKSRGESESRETPPHLWKTLVADRDPKGLPAPPRYHTALENALTKCNSNGDLITADLIRQGRPEEMVAFLQRAQDILWNRKFFLLERKKHPRFGLGPTSAQEGDIVCIFFGCSVPVVLRKVENPGPPAYQLIGEAFIHDMMDGQALNEYRNHHGFGAVGTEFRLV